MSHSIISPRYVGVFNNLPKTAYIKMIDIWFIFCMIIPFAEVLLQTYIESLRARAGQSISVNHHGRAVDIKNTEVFYYEYHDFN